MFTVLIIDKEVIEDELRTPWYRQKPTRPSSKNEGWPSIQALAQNCVAVGLAQGFIEPLEATALHLVQETVVQFIGAYLAGKETLHFQDAFNDNIRSRFLGIKDYISAHYCASNRCDSKYWKEASQAKHRTAHLQQLMQLWQTGQDINAYLTTHKLHQYYLNHELVLLICGYQQFSHRQFGVPFTMACPLFRICLSNVVEQVNNLSLNCVTERSE